MTNNFDNWFSSKKNININCCSINEDQIQIFLNDLECLMYPGILEKVDFINDYIDLKLSKIKIELSNLLSTVEIMSKSKICSGTVIAAFLEKLPQINEIIDTDIDALFEGDPAAKSKKEIILCYPGFKAIFTYRIAHILYEINIPLLPRIISEYAHSKTGIDINPGASIGKYFFIDHGTGIVIGETCIIGNHVKLYQGVTLGALSLSAGRSLSNTKRHPTIENNVTIYSGASIFGGDTTIGKNTTIGSNAYITKSISENMLVTIEGQIEKKK